MTNLGRLLGGRVKTPNSTKMLFGSNYLSFQNMDKHKNILRFLQHVKRNLHGEGWLCISGNTVNPVCSVVNDSDPHFLRVPCWKITLFVIVPVLGPLVALIICYNWLHRRLAGAVVEQQTGPPISEGPSQS